MFSHKKYLLLTAIIAAIFYTLFILLPVFTVPGNDIAFQLSIYSPGDFVLMAFLALLVGLSTSLSIFSIKHGTRRLSAVPVGNTALSGASGIFAAVAGTAACVSCLGWLFAIFGLGIGSVFFVLKYQIYFLFGTLLLMFISLYFISKKVVQSDCGCAPKETK